MSILWELFEEFVLRAVCVFLFLTGEVLHWAFSLGSHRIRWWELQDQNVTWPKVVVGILFWSAVGSAVWQFAP